MFKFIKRFFDHKRDKQNAQNMHELGPEKSKGYNTFGRGAIISSIIGLIGVGLIILAFSLHAELTIKNFIPLIILYVAAVAIPLSELFVPIHKLHMQSIVCKNGWFFTAAVFYGIFLVSFVATIIVLVLQQ